MQCSMALFCHAFMSRVGTNCNVLSLAQEPYKHMPLIVEEPIPAANVSIKMRNETVYFDFGNTSENENYLNTEENETEIDPNYGKINSYLLT